MAGNLIMIVILYVELGQSRDFLKAWTRGELDW